MQFKLWLESRDILCQIVQFFIENRYDISSLNALVDYLEEENHPLASITKKVYDIINGKEKYSDEIVKQINILGSIEENRSFWHKIGKTNHEFFLFKNELVLNKHTPDFTRVNICDVQDDKFLNKVILLILSHLLKITEEVKIESKEIYKYNKDSSYLMNFITKNLSQINSSLNWHNTELTRRLYIDVYLVEIVEDLNYILENLLEDLNLIKVKQLSEKEYKEFKKLLDILNITINSLVININKIEEPIKSSSNYQKLQELIKKTNEKLTTL